MVELKVTLNNCKKPNDVYESLKAIIEELQLPESNSTVKVATNGNYQGYGLVHIERISSELPSKEEIEGLSNLVHKIVVALQKRNDVKQVEILQCKDVISEYFINNYYIAGGEEKDGYIIIKKLL